MVNSQFSRHVASLETREGCPITPGASFTKQFYLVPLASSNKDRRGIALDGHLKVRNNKPFNSVKLLKYIKYYILCKFFCNNYIYI